MERNIPVLAWRKDNYKRNVRQSAPLSGTRNKPREPQYTNQQRHWKDDIWLKLQKYSPIKTRSLLNNADTSHATSPSSSALKFLPMYNHNKETWLWPLLVFCERLHVSPFHSDRRCWICIKAYASDRRELEAAEDRRTAKFIIMWI